VGENAGARGGAPLGWGKKDIGVEEGAAEDRGT